MKPNIQGPHLLCDVDQSSYEVNQTVISGADAVQFPHIGCLFQHISTSLNNNVNSGTFFVHDMTITGHAEPVIIGFGVIMHGTFKSAKENVIDSICGSFNGSFEYSTANPQMMVYPFLARLESAAVATNPSGQYDMTEIEKHVPLPMMPPSVIVDDNTSIQIQTSIDKDVAHGLFSSMAASLDDQKVLVAGWAIYTNTTQDRTANIACSISFHKWTGDIKTREPGSA